MPGSDNDDDDDDLPKNKWKNVVSRHRGEKRVATGVMTAASVGLQAASLATGASSIAVIGAVAAGAAVSATGIGLVAAGGALTLGSMALGARSAYNTAQHLKRLEKIYAARGTYRSRCRVLPWSGSERLNAEFADLHGWVADKVLPWIIRQKKHKLGKKVTTAVGAGLLVGIWSAGRKAYKALNGTLGKRRTYFAECLAVHLITCSCPLAQDIVSELYSEDEMNKLRFMDSDTAAPLLADKMKSI
jgi:hypothetical protein